MIKAKKVISVLLVFFLITLTFLFVNSQSKQVLAEEVNSETDISEEKTSDEEISPYWLATLSLTLNGGNGKIRATAKNDFTLFSSTVRVILELYSSLNYCEDYNKMTFVTAISADDLDIGTTLVSEASTGGVEKFWLARMRYKEDSGDWKEKIASGRYSADGTYLGIK